MKLVSIPKDLTLGYVDGLGYRGFGFIKQLGDPRDFRFMPEAEVITNLPPRVDLSAYAPPVDDQGMLGSCTAFATKGALEITRAIAGDGYTNLSALFIYYRTRVREGTAQYDSGAQVRDAIKSVASGGASPEKDWPYIPSKFARRPVKAAYADAKQYSVTRYEAVTQDLSHLKAALAANRPVVFGFSVFSGFMSAETARTGMGQLPTPSETLEGGHAVCIIGYDDATERFMIRNSWGNTWGIKGYFSLPYAYVLNPQLASDFWTIEAVRA